MALKAGSAAVRLLAVPCFDVSAKSSSSFAWTYASSATSHGVLILLVPCSSVYFFREPSVTVLRWIYPLNLVINRDLPEVVQVEVDPVDSTRQYNVCIVRLTARQSRFDCRLVVCTD